jgi:DNA adenine methylase
MHQIQVYPSRVLECIRRYPVSKTSYYKIREIDPKSLSLAEQAARFIYLNALCFNGLYRTNKNGKFNVPYGSKHRQVIADPIAIYEASRLMQNTEFVCRDFEQTVRETGKGDFLYLDPPYATNERRTFTEYNEKAFTQVDLTRLLAAIDDAAGRGVKFVLSYANVSEVCEFGSRWQTVIVKARRNIAGFVDSRRTVEEVLVTNCR